MSNSLSHTSSSDSEQVGSSRLELSSIMEGELGANGVAPVARQTTLVLQGYFTEEARINNPDVSEHFSRLQGTGLTAADDEALFQLGLEMNRASLQLRERYSSDFEEMMGELGTSLSEVFSGLAEIAQRLFHNPSEISWSRILTFFSFAAWVLIKKGCGFVSRAFNQAQGLLSRVTDLLGNFNVFTWIIGKGGWTANKSHLTNEASIEQLQSTGDGANIPEILHNPPLPRGNSILIEPPQSPQNGSSNGNRNHQSGDAQSPNGSSDDHPDTSSSSGSGPSTFLYFGGAAVVATVAFLLYRRFK